MDQIVFWAGKRPAGAFWLEQVVFWAGKASRLYFELEKCPAGAFWADQIIFWAGKASRRVAVLNDTGLALFAKTILLGQKVTQKWLLQKSKSELKHESKSFQKWLTQKSSGSCPRKKWVEQLK